MASKRGEHLPRLSIATNFNPATAVGTTMFSPALPPIQPFLPMSTPMQPFFVVPHMPAAPQRPTHRPNQASMQLAAAGIHPPPNFMTPLTGHFPRSSIALPGPLLQQQAPPSHPFPGRGRRQLSIGGPPKAILGGPARKLSPVRAAQAANPTSITTAEKRKKIAVDLPKETIHGDEGRLATRPEWARQPLANSGNDTNIPVLPVPVSTADIYPPDAWRVELPDVIDVYLPGKTAWEEIKRKDIEEKLEKLGVERGSGSNVPHIHAPHARAASISSPADPALLLFKLNKLQLAQQEASSTSSTNPNSLAVSPQPPFMQPPFGLSPSPRRLTRPGLSLAQPPFSDTNSLFSNSPSNLGVVCNGIVDNEFGAASTSSLSALHGRRTTDYMPPPLSAVGAPAPNSQLDFIRGFGLDVPLESEEEDEEEAVQRSEPSEDEEDYDRTQDMDLDDKSEVEGTRAMVEVDDATTATEGDSRLHSRHVSRISAALSLRSVGEDFQAQFELEEREGADKVDVIASEQSAQDEILEEEEVQRPADPADDWTGSEDLYLGTEPSDDESIGEFSNPSDEEHARQERSDRRMRRRTAASSRKPPIDTDQPRWIPDFPRPPDNTHIFHGEEEIISNPSEENLIMGGRADFLGVSTERYYPESSMGGGSGLSSDAHSRVPSGQYSGHDPALAHSRQVSGSQRGSGYHPLDRHHRSVPSAGDVKRETLNPYAKPFVFGATSGIGNNSSGGEGGEGNSSSGTWQPFKGEATPPMPIPTVSTHSRMPSFGKPLSANAPEFKPGQFNFRLPGAPQMPLVPPPVVPPLSPVDQLSPMDTSSPYKVQGREKRRRRDSQLGEDDSMTSFRFPLPLLSSPAVGNIGHRHRHRSGSLDLDLIGGQSRLDSSAHPFTFAEFSTVTSNMPSVPKEGDDVEQTYEGDSSLTAKIDVELQKEEDQVDPPVPSSASKTRKAPIPLDFKHPSNTVPAGLFKALATNGEERTRRGVRSRLSSRELFEHMHRPSMDDTNVALIARKASRNHLLTDPTVSDISRMDEVADDDDVFTSLRPHVRRRSSLPEALVDNDKSASSSTSDDADDADDGLGVGPMSRMEVHRLECVIGQLLDDKLVPLRAELSKREPTVKAEMEAMMADLISIFRAQLRDSVAKSLDDSQMDARGELDFQLIKDLIEQSYQEMLSTLHREGQRIASVVGNDGLDVVNAIDGASKRTVNAVVEALSEFSVRQEAVALNMPSRERDLMVEKLTNVLSPLIESLHTAPIDYEFLTRELAQAVKPHISQLIDLASDKRETASLIVDRIMPLLPTLDNVSIDTDAITLKLITEVRRAIAPIDAFEIKEQVADLVVERLDSRFAVRDKTFNVDVVTSKVTESVSGIIEAQLGSVMGVVEEISALQKADGERHETIAATLKDIRGTTDVPGRQLDDRLQQLKTAQDVMIKHLERPIPSPVPDPNVLVIRNLVEALENNQVALEQQTQEVLIQSKAIAEKIDTLPVTTWVSGLETLTELITSSDTSKHDLEELRKLNTEYQIQLTKARSSYGQVRVEKDALNEKFSIVESDRDRLRVQIKDLEEAGSTKATETSALEARNAELEDALAKALTRLQAADVATQADQMTIVDLEKAKHEVDVENESLKTKITALETEVEFANRERETAAKNLEALQSQHEHLISQQRNWDTLNAASEKINLVYKLLENADEEDQQELRLQRERSRALEAENAALQKRLKDIDVKLSHADKNSNTALHTLTLAQQRSTEWELRAKEYEGRLEMVQTQLEQAEQTHTQLEADYSIAKVQLEEHEADSRLLQDRENKDREQIAALEAKCLRLQNELEKANSAAKLVVSSTPFRPHNGVLHPPRPDSRMSTVNGASANRRIASSASGRNIPTKLSSSSASQQPSVWDSMHAPSTNGVHHNGWELVSNSIHPSEYAPSTPKPRKQIYNQYQRGAPSPTPSVVSAAPTMGEDGWWS